MTSSDEDAEARASRVIAQAAVLPSLDEVRELAERAVRHGGTRQMSMDEIRALAAEAVTQAEQVTMLLRRLTDLLSDRGPAPGGAAGEP